MTYYIALVASDGYSDVLIYTHDKSYLYKVFDDIAVPYNWDHAELRSTIEDLDTHVTYTVLKSKE